MIRRRSFVLSSLAIGFGFLAVSGSAQALEGKRADTFASAISGGCIKGLKQANAPYSDAAIRGYCGCTGRRTADQLQDRHMADFARAGGQATPELKAMTQRISKACGGKHLR